MKKTGPIRVSISEFHVARSPAILKSHGLGSCVGVTIYDPETKTGGLAHILLPSSKNLSRSSLSEQNPLKFADIAIEKMTEEVVRQGCKPDRLIAKIAGGANMFPNRYNANPDHAAKPGIGQRNVRAVQKKLKELGIALAAKDVGGESGRTLEFDTESGDIYISTSNGEKTTI